MANEFDFPKIFSEQFKFDMGPWLTEKSEHGLRVLVELGKNIKKIEGKIDKDILNYLHSDLSEAMFQITKIYSFSLGSQWEVGDDALVFDKHDDGFEELKVKYGILDKTSKQIEKEKEQSEKERRLIFFNKIKEYLLMEQDPGRSLLQEHFEQHLDFLNEQTTFGRYMTKIEQDLYRMANGEIPWSDFIFEANGTMDFLSDFLKYTSI
jgi:hypothetical protein